MTREAKVRGAIEKALQGGPLTIDEIAKISAASRWTIRTYIYSNKDTVIRTREGRVVKYSMLAKKRGDGNV